MEDHSSASSEQKKRAQKNRFLSKVALVEKIKDPNEGNFSKQMEFRKRSNK
jgi:hypothetical protein